MQRQNQKFKEQKALFITSLRSKTQDVRQIVMRFKRTCNARLLQHPLLSKARTHRENWKNDDVGRQERRVSHGNAKEFDQLPSGRT